MAAAYRLPIRKGVWFMAASGNQDKDWRREAKEMMNEILKYLIFILVAAFAIGSEILVREKED